MSSNDLTITLVGWVGTEPKHYTGGTGTPFTSFRMASTRRWFDARQGTWVEGRTEWFTVKVWRQAAVNVAESLRKSDPVVVHGRLATEEWDGQEGGTRTSLVLEASAIGPDLTFGSARFARTVVAAREGSESAGGAADGDEALPDGTPASASDDPWATVRPPDDAAEPDEDAATESMDRAEPALSGGARA